MLLCAGESLRPVDAVTSSPDPLLHMNEPYMDTVVGEAAWMRILGSTKASSPAA